MPVYSIAPTGWDYATTWHNGRKIGWAPDGTLWAGYSVSVGVGVAEIRVSYSIDGGVTWTEEVVAADPAIWYVYPTLAVDSLGGVHIAYFDNINATVEYRYRSPAGVWAAAVVIFTNIIHPNMGPALTIDSLDEPHVAAYPENPLNVGFHNIAYRYRAAGVWQAVEWVTAINRNQYVPSIAVDLFNTVHITWSGYGWGVNTNRLNIQYRQRTVLGGWQPQEAITDVATDESYPSVAVDSNSIPHIVWDMAGTNMGYRNRIGGVWSPQETQGGDSFAEPIITFTRGDVAYIIYYNTIGVDRSRYITRTAGVWGWPTVFTPGIVDDIYPVPMYSFHPRVSGQSVNVPADGFLAVFSSDTIDEVRFFTLIALPVVTTNAAVAQLVSGILNGTLDDDGGEACDCGFEWGPTPAYGNTTPTQSKTTGETFSQTISGLTPETTYYFRAFGTNSMGTGYGAGGTFTTQPRVLVNKAYALSREEL